jgi:hypothetical protein
VVVVMQDTLSANSAGLNAITPVRFHMIDFEFAFAVCRHGRRRGDARPDSDSVPS